ncbi:hypothetical protein Vi05172_g1024 [Venturia inaequalis]|nr:hypothetical protein Vi05172_g1024 [Venturia inaequalis]
MKFTAVLAFLAFATTTIALPAAQDPGHVGKSDPSSPQVTCPFKNCAKPGERRCVRCP